MTDFQDQVSSAFRQRYRIERELGRGGMAHVFLAHDLERQQRVTIKVLRPEIGLGLSRERFLREVALLGRLQHPNIVSLIDSGEVEGLLYLVTPYFEGETLRQRLERDAPLRVADALHIALQVGQALEHAHGQGVIHRDIKPENILIDRGRVIVADFGLANAMSGPTLDRITAAGLVLGTPAYMSPEQVVGAGVDARSDVYSLGCVLYEMLAGEPPFAGATAQAIIASHMRERQPRLHAVRPEISQSVEQAVDEALAKDPADRFASIAELMHACARALEQLATEASRETVRHGPPCKLLREPLAPRYKITSQIGEGGMSIVCRADDVRLGRDVAIKVLRPELAATIWAERFLQEIKVTAMLTHPHILTLLDYGSAVGLLYYVMPYIQGESVGQKISREGQLAVEEAVTIARTVADALQYAHDCGIIHRDIKPDNVLLRGSHAWVADFGIAVSIDAARGPRFTKTGFRVGSPEYMSPEHAAGERSLDGRSDIYSLGCLLYAMLVGKPPFTGSDEQILASKRMGSVPRICAQRTDVPPALEKIVQRAMATSPDDRYATASELREVLTPA